ncbi:hypothetical protein LCGC14_2909990, partial [marine sediment metagenome]
MGYWVAQSTVFWASVSIVLIVGIIFGFFLSRMWKADDDYDGDIANRDRDRRVYYRAGIDTC